MCVCVHVCVCLGLAVCVCVCVHVRVCVLRVSCVRVCVGIHVYECVYQTCSVGASLSSMTMCVHVCVPHCCRLSRADAKRLGQQLVPEAVRQACPSTLHLFADNVEYPGEEPGHC